jgi:tRNA-2-methylthio-N6-dimethylallyladenosine synthase
LAVELPIYQRTGDGVVKEKAVKKYLTLTYGCQMNERDTATIAGLVERSGYQEASSFEEADLIVLNTCSVRHSAENKVYGKLGELKRFKQDKPDMLIALGGCMAQLDEVRDKLKKMGIVDVVFGTHNLHELPYLLEKAEAGLERPVIDVWDKEKKQSYPHRMHQSSGNGHHLCLPVQ